MDLIKKKINQLFTWIKKKMSLNLISSSSQNNSRISITISIPYWVATNP